MNGENNKVCLVEIREWDYDCLRVDEVRVFGSRESAEGFLRVADFGYNEKSDAWYRGDVEANIKERVVEG